MPGDFIMGGFYSNYTLKHVSTQAIAAVLAGRSAVVGPAQDGCAVVFDQQSDGQDQEVMASLAADLSHQLSCPVLALLNHDDDILWYQLYLDGKLVDEYDSSPGYFDPAAEPSPPSGGDAKKLCAAFGATDVQAVEAILRKSSYDDDGYVFAAERHAALARALRIPSLAVGNAFASFDEGKTPEGLAPGEILRTV